MTGLEVRGERVKRGIKQKTLAAYAKIDPAALSRYENGHDEPLKDETRRLIEEGLRIIPLLPHKEIVELEATAK